jgi:hypothetical protein
VSRFKRVLSIVLAVILLITLVPPYEGAANTGAFMKITNFNTAPATTSGGKEVPDWSHESASGSQPSTVTSRFVNLEVEYNNISTDNIALMYYEVKNVDTGVTREFKNNPPVVLGGQRVRFENVELTEGLNKITVMLDTPNRPMSVPAWITFTEVTTIQELTINDRTFSNGIFVPESNQQGLNDIWISGIAPNATEVRAYTVANPQGQLSSLFNQNTGEFYFTAGGQNSDLQLRPGDNYLEIIASNPFRTYRTEREFVYNNGRAFLFNTQAEGSQNLQPSSYQKLLFQPTFSGGTTDPYSINLRTDVKINKGQNGPEHNQIQFTLNGQIQNDFEVQFSNFNGGTVDVEIGGVAAGQLNVTDAGDYYLVRDLTLSNFPIDEGQSRQSLEVMFLLNGNQGVQANTQNFVYYYVNDNYPYVEQVTIKETGNPLYDGIEVRLTDEVIELQVFTQNSPDAVRVYSNHQANAIGTFTQQAGGVFEVQLDRNSLPEGRSNLRFVPVSGGTEYTVGEKSYLVNYNPTPYVYAQNVYNGQIFNSTAELPAQFILIPQNIPQNVWTSNIKVIFNDTERTFTINNGELRVPVTSSDFHSGMNVLKIEYYSSLSAPPTSTSTYELFYFEDNVPDILNLDLTQYILTNYHFVRLEGQTQRYYTQENFFEFETTFVNAEEVSVVVNSPHRDDPMVEVWTKSGNNLIRDTDRSNYSIMRSFQPDGTGGDFVRGTQTSWSFDLEGSGTYTVEVTVTNRSGLYSTRMLEIVREPATYKIHFPEVNPANNTATVNGNFTRFYVEAEGADKIVVRRGAEVTEKTLVQLRNEEKELFVFDVTGLRRGNNNISFTVVRGSREDTVNVTLINADTPVVGAQHKENISSNRIRAFNNTFELRFPRGTILHRNDVNAPDQSLSPSMDILVGIADPIDGRVNKTLHPLPGETSPFPSRSGWDTGYLRLVEPTGRFRQVSPLYWIDAGQMGQTSESQPFIGGLYPYERGLEFYTRNANNYRDLYVPSQPGQLTLSYDPNIVQSAWRYVTVYHFGYNENHQGIQRFEWKNIGGVVDQRRNTITVPLYEFGYYVVMYMDRSYDDIIGHSWARNHLETLFSKGIMVPKEQTRFVTNEPISRGEFATLLVKAFEIPLDYEGQGTFNDVRRVDPFSNGLYEYKYIETAARVGIVRGSLGGFFQPRNNITREDAAVMIARAANLRLESNDDRARQRLERLFTDVHNFSQYTMAPVLAVSQAGLIEGKPNVSSGTGRNQTYYFDPKANLTRAEAAAIMMRVLLQQKKIPSL